MFSEVLAVLIFCRKNGLVAPLPWACSISLDARQIQCLAFWRSTHISSEKKHLHLSLNIPLQPLHQPVGRPLNADSVTFH